MTNDAMIDHDLYKDIHKAIRAELFDVTLTAGRLDPGDGTARVALAERIDAMVHLLVSHAEHEDAFVGPLLDRHLPRFQRTIEQEHVAIDARMLGLGTMAAAAVDARDGAPARARLHALYLELGSFTGVYLAHVDLEERQVMPALAAAVTVDDLLAVHDQIVSSIPPEEMAHGLGLMLPAMNADDRFELLGGMQQGAPAEVFAGVVGLAQTVLAPADFHALGERLGLVLN